ncbi:MAG: STAS domain-containing protein [Spirochaetales bacterium]|nr:STAS domain-containing protein [Spirochaetales bacterium]
MDFDNKNDILIVTPRIDNIDASNVNIFKKKIIPEMENYKNMILDLRNIAFVDSSGLGSFLSFLKRLEEKNGTLVLCEVPRSVKLLFEIVRLQEIITIKDTKEDAVSFIQENIKTNQ